MLALIFLIAAIILFILSAVGYTPRRFSLQSAGLACLTASLLVGGARLL